MTIETSIYLTLNSIDPDGGVWPVARTDGQITTPFIVYSRVSSVPTSTLDGDAPALTRVRVQVDCYGATYEEAKALADSVRAAMLAAPFKNLPDSELDLFDSDAKLYRVTMDFFCWQ